MSNPFTLSTTDEGEEKGEIPLQELSSINNNKSSTGHHIQHVQFGGHEDDSSESDCENIHYSKGSSGGFQNNFQNGSSDDVNNISELPPLTSLSVTGADVWFNGISCVFSVLSLALEITLVGWHYATGHMWGSGLTALWIGIGGVALMRRFFWGMSQDKLERLFGKRMKCVRISVNGFPWLATIITPYMTTLRCNSSRTNSMQIHSYIQLQDWSRMLLRVQSLAQAAPQAMLQLLLLLEDLDGIGIGKATTMTLSIITCLTNMMIANLPSKSDVAMDELMPSKAAYSPYSRLFIGLRMISSFASRTMSLSLFLSSFRCTKQIYHQSAETSLQSLIAHLIPLSILIIPRLTFSLIEYIRSKVKKSNQQSPATFGSILLTYTASVFIPFSEPAFIFWYILLETLVFMLIGSGLAFHGGCWHILNGIIYLIVFGVMFGFVPVVVPWLRARFK